MNFKVSTPLWKFALLLIFFANAALVSAQEKYHTYVPTKDVAMLVDVSVSVKGDKEGHEDSEKIIQDIVSGRGFSNKRLGKKWEVEASHEMATLFGAYLGQLGGGETAELRPLLAEHGNFLAMRIGIVQTVLTAETSKQLKNAAQIDELIHSGYPRTSEMNDKSTCFWLAMARTAGTLSQNSKLGYYLFVVSDEEDDPDYRKDGPPGHTSSDFKAYTQELARTYPETAIRGEIARYFDFTGLNARSAETYKARSDFKQVPIAKFFQAGGRSSRKVSLSWYAMGVVPERVHIPRIPPPPLTPRLAAAVARYIPPQLHPTIQWLGGIGEVPKKQFNYKEPLIIWQIKNAEASRFESNENPVLQLGTQTRRNRKFISSRHDQQTWALPTDLNEETFEITLRHGALDAEASIWVQPRSYWWLYLFAIVSAAVALVIFIYAWKSLRQPRIKSSAYAVG
jgi:hypothetical protein